MSDEVETENLAVTENYVAWVSHEPDDETIYHLELGSVTVHLFPEEWEEVVELVRIAAEEARKR
ncbi:MAG: hypothetical protein K8L97_23255 [Anaerolineae bacterium]|nr:hypothetical protein [Anaerolineae bacterium]